MSHWAAKESAGKNRLGTRLEQVLLYWALELKPSLKKKFFPDQKTSRYWTEEEESSDYAWCVNFTNDSVSNIHKDIYVCVRPVRASEPR